MPDSSRRNFLISGLAVPAAASAARPSDEQQRVAPRRRAGRDQIKPMRKGHEPVGKNLMEPRRNGGIR